MAHVQRPHDKLYRTVFTDHAEAAALLRAHLPDEIARDLRWSTLTLNRSSDRHGIVGRRVLQCRSEPEPEEQNHGETREHQHFLHA